MYEVWNSLPFTKKKDVCQIFDTRTCIVKHIHRSVVVTKINALPVPVIVEHDNRCNKCLSQACR